VSQIEEYHRAGHFPPGNMGPKIESVIHFLRSGGKEAVITSFEHLCEAAQGRGGSHIVPDTPSHPRAAKSELEVPVLR
jgi:carbamate kinase